MARIGFLLLIAPIWLLSLLPLRVHYVFANLIYWLLSSVIGYRRGVVYINIARSFPEYKYKKVRKVVRKFYRNFADIIAENLWMVSRPFVRVNRVSYIENPEVMKELYDKGKSVILVSGHQGNWEFFPYLLTSQQETMGFSGDQFKIVYKRQHSALMDRLMRWFRTRGGKQELLESGSAARHVFKNKDTQSCYVLVADQVPLPGSKFVVDFLNRQTLMINGPELMSVKADLPIVFMSMERIKRGRYKLKFSLISENPSQTTFGEITKRFASLLEESIRSQPDNWLWSHRRWKRGVEGNG